MSTTPTKGLSTDQVADSADAVDAGAEPELAEADMKKKELIELVVSRSGIKKKDAKPVVEAMLSVLGEAIADGRELNLQPFGKLRINRSEVKHNGRVTVCKLRQSTARPGAKTPLADVPEDV